MDSTKEEWRKSLQAPAPSDDCKEGKDDLRPPIA